MAAAMDNSKLLLAAGEGERGGLGVIGANDTAQEEAGEDLPVTEHIAKLFTARLCRRLCFRKHLDRGAGQL